ncbi:MAG: leucine-rich repeat domain-containing protein [Eubacterium sp.]|jgi:hypothetical protein
MMRKNKIIEKLKILFGTPTGVAVSIATAVFVITLILNIISVSYHPSDEIKFNDANLENAIKYGLHEIVLTEDEAEEVTELTISDAEPINDLTDLKFFPNLKELTITGTEVKSFEGIQDLHKLKSFSCTNSKSDISALYENEITIKELNISGNEVIDLPKLFDSCGKLEKLTANECQITGSVVCYSESITELSLVKNAITNFGGSFDKLEKLSLNSNRIISMAADLPSILEINLNNNYGFVSIESLLKYVTLNTLKFSNDPIDSIDGISALKNLNSIDLTGTKVTDVTELEKIETFNSIFLDPDFDRTQIDFLIGNFRDGDIETKRYLIGKKEEL